MMLWKAIKMMIDDLSRGSIADPFNLYLAEDDADYSQTGSLRDGHIANRIPAIRAYRLRSQYREPTPPS